MNVAYSTFDEFEADCRNNGIDAYMLLQRGDYYEEFDGSVTCCCYLDQPYCGLVGQVWDDPLDGPSVTQS